MRTPNFMCSAPIPEDGNGFASVAVAPAGNRRCPRRNSPKLRCGTSHESEDNGATPGAAYVLLRACGHFFHATLRICRRKPSIYRYKTGEVGSI